MTFPPRGVLAAALSALLFTVAAAQQPMPPDKQAEVALTAGQKAYNDGNLPFAAQRFQDVLAKFPNTLQANAARFGLALCLINGPQQDIPKAAELLVNPSNDAGFADRGQALHQLG